MNVVPEHVFGKHDNIDDFANDADWVSAGPYVLTRSQSARATR